LKWGHGVESGGVHVGLLSVRVRYDLPFYTQTEQNARIRWRTQADLLPRTRLLTRFLLARSRATLIGNIRYASGGEMGREKLSGTDAQKLEVRMRFNRVLPAEAQALARKDHTTLSAWIRNLVVREVKARKRDHDSKVDGTPEAGQP